MKRTFCIIWSLLILLSVGGQAQAFEPIMLASWIGGNAWNDANGDGLRDPEEQSMPGIGVLLMDCMEHVIAETVTDANGDYVFDSLVPNYYNVQFIPPEGYVFSSQGELMDYLGDSDADESGKCACTWLDPGEHDLTWDAGLLGISEASEVTVDIKPGNEMDCVNPKSSGVIPVAIMSSESFDATTIDSETISMAGASVKSPGKSGRYLCRDKDVNKDRMLDLLCKVSASELEANGDQAILRFEAQTMEGETVFGEDSICIVPGEEI